MIFSSYLFLFAFLPLVLAGYYGLLRWVSGSAALWFIVAASLGFYGTWNIWHLPIFLASIAGNYLFVHLLGEGRRGRVLALAIVLNLAGLAWLKYRNFFAGALLGQWGGAELLPPLGISFFTFQQIALLIDVYRGKARPAGFLDYASFITFFPHLPAGPIVYYGEMEQRITRLRNQGEMPWHLIAPGCVLFAMGMFKKTLLADPIGREAVTALASPGHITMLEAWYGCLAFTAQLYFDFSGYADMAIGLGMLFGFQLPTNFAAPYRACNITDFWKRWHITMTRFFIANVYSPLALHLTRLSVLRRFPVVVDFLVASAVPIVLTFLVSGLWHGAGWNFVMLGLVHGVALTVHAGWRRARMPALPKWLGWCLTMVVLVISLVFFRAGSMESALSILSAMFDPSHLVLPDWMGGVATWLALPVGKMEVFHTGTVSVTLPFWIGGLFLVAVLAPELSTKRDQIRLGWRTAVLSACAVLLSLSAMNSPQAFVYFQF